MNTVTKNTIAALRFLIADIIAGRVTVLDMSGVTEPGNVGVLTLRMTGKPTIPSRTR